jgi:hypothetical protein
LTSRRGSGIPRRTLAGARLVAAPPVYAPGGPVLLVRTVPTLQALQSVERSACRRGGVVAVVAQQAGDAATADLLRSAGYAPTTEFLE